MMKASLARLAGFATAAVLVVMAQDAHAAGNANGFGDKGEIIISADRLVPLFGYTATSVETPAGTNIGQVRETSSNGAGLSLLFGRDFSGGTGALGQPFNIHSFPRIGIDVSVINHLTIGMGFAIAFGFSGALKTSRVTGPNTTNTTTTDSPSSFAFGIAPRVGYVIPLGEHLAFWPRAGIGIYNSSITAEQLDNNDNVIATGKVSDTVFSLDVDPQLAIIPVEHFFFTVGPLLNIPLAGNRSNSLTRGGRTDSTDEDISVFHFGLHASVGGWINVF